MGGSPTPDTKLIVKHTFLEIVVDDSEVSCDSRKRSFTDGAIITAKHKDGDAHNVSSVDAQHQARVHEQMQASGLQSGDALSRRLTLAAENARLAEENAQLQALAENAAAANQVVAPVYTAWGTAPGVQQNGATVPSFAMMAAAAPLGGQPAWFIPVMAMPTQNCSPDYQLPEEASSSTSKAAESSNSAQHAPKTGAKGEKLNLANHVPARSPGEEDFTTLMLRNLPNQYTRDMLVDLLNNEGFRGKFNFVYLPIDFKTHAGLGYAFVDLVSVDETERARRHFEGFSAWGVRSEKVCTVSWSHAEQQGYGAHVERYRNSPVMHETIPDSWKPALFQNGKRVEFPKPTRRLRNPAVRRL